MVADVAEERLLVIEAQIDALEKNPRSLRQDLVWRRADLGFRLAALRRWIGSMRHQVNRERDREHRHIRNSIAVFEATVRHLQWVWTGEFIESDSESDDDGFAVTSVKVEPVEELPTMEGAGVVEAATSRETSNM